MDDWSGEGGRGEKEDGSVRVIYSWYTVSTVSCFFVHDETYSEEYFALTIFAGILVKLLADLINGSSNSTVSVGALFRSRRARRMDRLFC